MVVWGVVGAVVCAVVGAAMSSTVRHTGSEVNTIARPDQE